MIDRNKIKKYIVIFAISFLSFISFTFADEDYTNVLAGMGFGETRSIPSKGRSNFTCKGEGDLKVLSLKKKADNAGYEVSFGSLPTEDGVDVISCNWHSSVGVGSKTGSISGGSESYEVYYEKATETYFDIVINGNLNKLDTLYDVMAQIGASEIIDVKPGRGAEYIDFSGCNAKVNKTSCKVKATTTAVNPTEVLITEADITYKVKGFDQEIVAHITFKTSINGGPRAYSGDFGTCNFDSSQWRYAERGGYKFWESNTLNGLKMPNCSSEKSKYPAEFKGWVASPYSETSIYSAQQTGVCSSKYDLIAPGSTITGENATNYYACYEFADGISIVLGNNMTLNDTTGTCKSIESDPNRYYCSTSSDIALPDVTFGTGTYEGTKSLQGWKRESDGQILPPGTVVSPNGDTYTAITERSFSQTADYKSIVVGDTEALVINGIQTCDVASGSEYLTTKMSDGECWVTGNKATPEDIYADVIIGVDDGSTRTFKFTVEDYIQSEAGRNGFVIDVDESIIFGENDEYTEGRAFYNKMCSDFNITSGSEAPIGGNLYSSSYKVGSRCKNDTGKYFAICLDPGRLGPASTNKVADVAIYSRTADIDPNSDFGKLMGYIAYIFEKEGLTANAFGDVTNKFRVAAFVAIRTVALMDNYDGGIKYNDSILKGHYNKYKKFAETLKSLYQKYGDDLSGTKNKTNGVDELRSYIKSSSFGLKNEYVDTLVDILTHYKKYEVSTKKTFERTIDSTEFIQVGNGYQITYKGTITYPDGAKPDESKGTHGVIGFSKNGVTGKVSNYEQNKELSTDNRLVYNYEFLITVDNASTVTPPDTQKEEEEYSFKFYYIGHSGTGGAFIANPAGSAVLQRMVIFSTDNYVYSYFPVSPNSENICNTLPALDYKSCPDGGCGAEPTNSTFNPALFRTSNCCKYVLNEVEYSKTIGEVCNSNCNVSTMQTACSVKPNCSAEDIKNGNCDASKLYDSNPELYTIKDGAKYINGTYQNRIGTCIVNVNKKGSEAFNDSKVGKDDNGNSLMIDSYKLGEDAEGVSGNRYCRVSCGEEWQVAAEGFGSFVGANAVTAGSFFSLDKPLFISGTRTCYTTYIDYEQYLQDLYSKAADMTDAYNEYSRMSHIYSDISSKDIPYSDYVDEPTKQSACISGYDVTTTYTYNIPGDDTSGVASTSHSKSCKEDLVDFYTFNVHMSGKFVDPDLGLPGVYAEYNPDGSQKGILSYLTSDSITTSCSVSRNTDSSSSTADTVTGDCATYNWNSKGDLESIKQDVFEKNSSKLLGDVDEGTMVTDFHRIQSDMAAMKQYQADMFNCQHFMLYNDTKDGKANNSVKTAMLEGVARSYVIINTAFEPEASYVYDENAYMTILNGDNVLEEYTELNDAYYGGEGKFATSTNTSKIASLKWYDPNDVKFDDKGNLQNLTADDLTVKLNRNLIDTHYYNPDYVWSGNDEISANYHDPGSEVAKNSKGTIDSSSRGYAWCIIGGETTGGGGTVAVKEGAVTSAGGGFKRENVWTGNLCNVKSFSYLKAHYIKTSLSNSSFYRNKGRWYIRANDIKEHGSTLAEAWANARKRQSGPNYNGDDVSLWSKFGATNNTFPISITTPRNLYQYTYTFGKMGIFNNGRLGRIMGDVNLQVVGSNNRTCFYEVVESVCKCCGDPIVPYTMEDVPSPSEYLEGHRDTLTYELSDDDEIGINSNGTLGFTNTTISLNDLDAVGKAGGRTLSTNWGNDAVYRYANSRFHTAKGNLALQAIESIGEEIYERTPEYSYVLTPQTLASIRDYNDIYGYEVNYNNLKIYGRYSISPLKACTDINNCQWEAGGSYSQEEFDNNTVTFRHYGSTFLEEFMEDYTSTTALSRLTGNDNVCVITENATYNELLTLSNSGNCRWIDYIDSENDGTKHYYRLAFK